MNLLVLSTSRHPAWFPQKRTNTFQRRPRGSKPDALTRYSPAPTRAKISVIVIGPDASKIFEWCGSVGVPVYGLAFGRRGQIALRPQAIILGSILGMTGIPPIEKHSARSNGNAFLEYQMRESRFVPTRPLDSQRHSVVSGWKFIFLSTAVP